MGDQAEYMHHLARQEIAAKDARIAELEAALREAMEWNWLDDTPHGQVPENVVEQCNKALGIDG